MTVEMKTNQEGTIKRKAYGQVVELPVGGGFIGDSGFTLFEVQTIDSIAASQRQQPKPISEPVRSLFDLD